MLSDENHQMGDGAVQLPRGAAGGPALLQRAPLSVQEATQDESENIQYTMVYDDRIVAIYYDNIRIAQHKRDRRPNEYSTLPEHMPSNHRFYAEWSPERFRSWAKAIGEEVLQVIEMVLRSRKHPEQAYKVCMGILNISKKYGAERLNKVCKQANQFGTCSLKRIESMLKLDLEEEHHPELELVPRIPDHENIRGSRYYN